MIRALLGQQVDGSAPLLYALVLVGQGSAGEVRRKWVYERLTFVSDSVSSERLASFFVAGESHTLTLASTQVIAEFQDTGFMWEKKPSLAQYDRLSLPWPSVIYTPRIANIGNVNQSDYLVGATGTPSFPTFGAAFNAFMHDDFVISGTGNPSLGDVSVRIIDERARIQRVRISAASLDVWIGGRSVNGCYLELNGVETRQVIPMTKSGRISFPLPSGLPSEAWVWLKHGTEWLDFRALYNWGGYKSSDVEVEQLPDDPGANLSQLAAQGEGLHLEYKSKIPDSRDEKRHVFKTIVAFANGEGGTILFGVDDDGTITGLTDSLPEARARLNDMLRDLVRPSPEVHIEERLHDGRNIIMLRVSPNSGTLHALTINPNRPDYFIRRDATTFYAQPDEIAAILHKATEGSNSSGWPYFSQTRL